MDDRDRIVPIGPPGGVVDQLARPMRDLRISVMDRCNFRCTYCMPSATYHDGYRFLQSSERLTFAEIVRVARASVPLGVRKLRITGGEPLLRANLPELIGDLSSIAGIEDVALTTNGVLLARHATELKAAGLRRVTISLDTLDPEVFARMTGGHGSVEEVLAGIDQARRVGLGPLKINAVIQRGVNDHTALDLVDRFRGRDVTVRFIEYMDVGNRNDWRPELVVPSAELLERVAARWPLERVAPPHRGAVAERYAFADGQGEIGFISSISQPFCADCSRARVSSDGLLYLCLFATSGVDLRGPLRAGAIDAMLTDVMRNAWAARTDQYSVLRARLRPRNKIEMHYIGG